MGLELERINIIKKQAHRLNLKTHLSSSIVFSILNALISKANLNYYSLYLYLIEFMILLAETTSSVNVSRSNAR